MIAYGCELEFQDEILLRREECKSWEKAKNFKFSSKGKIGNFVGMGQAKTCNFLKSRMTKWTSLLKSSRKS